MQPRQLPETPVYSNTDLSLTLTPGCVAALATVSVITGDKAEKNTQAGECGVICIMQLNSADCLVRVLKVSYVKLIASKGQLKLNILSLQGLMG